jgi:large subunit ribosomal protein L15
VPNVKRYNTLRLDRIQAYIDNGKLDHKGVIDAAALVAAGVIRRPLDGVRLVLGPAEFKAKKVTFNVTHASKGVVAAIEALGGKIDMPKAEEPKADA